MNKNIDFDIMRKPGFYNEVLERRKHNIDSAKNSGGWKSINECPICGFNDNTEAQFTTVYSQYIYCKKCKCVYSNRIPTKQNTGKFEMKDFQEIKNLSEELIKKYRQDRFAEERIQIIKKYIKKDMNKCNLLDVGCSTGFFLEVAKKYFKNVSGMEKDKVTAEYAEKVLGIPIHTCDVSKIKESYDVITLFDVLEHIEKPLELLHSLKSKLNDNGIILAFTPNYHSISFRMLESGSTHLYPGHVVLFSEGTVDFISNELYMQKIMFETQGMDWFDMLAYDRDINKIPIDNSIIKKHVNKLQDITNALYDANSLRFILRK